MRIPKRATGFIRVVLVPCVAQCSTGINPVARLTIHSGSFKRTFTRSDPRSTFNMTSSPTA
jgi:hypothetical protein